MDSASPLAASQSDLRELFAAVEVDQVPPHGTDEAMLFVTARQDPSLLFRGEALSLFRSIQGHLAGSALAQGGPSRKAIEQFLIEACTVSVMQGEEEALRILEALLTTPPGSWTIAEAINAYIPNDDLRLGSCRFFRSLPDGIVSGHILTSARERLSGPIVLVDVEARDETSARLIAQDRFDETRSIFMLAGRQRGSLPANLVIDHGERVTVTSGPTALISTSLWDDKGNVHPNLRGLSDAAARLEEHRSDWERRAIAAARWWANAARTSWPSESLASCMTALECLFVEGRRVRNKGDEIAKQVSARWVFKHHTREEQRRWLETLYKARNDAVHEGRQYVEDLEVDRLIDLAGQAVAWGAWHLSPYHSGTGKPCATFSEAFSHDLNVSHQAS